MHAQVAHGMGDVQREVRELLDTPSANGDAAAVGTPGSGPPAGPEAGPAPGPADPPAVLAGDLAAAGAARAAAQGRSAERGASQPGQVSAAAACAAASVPQPSSSSDGQQDSLALHHSSRGAPQASSALGGGHGSASGAGHLNHRAHSGGGSSSSGGPAADSLASESDESEGSVIGFDAETLTPAERCTAAAAGELVDAARAAVRLLGVSIDNIDFLHACCALLAVLGNHQLVTHCSAGAMHGTQNWRQSCTRIEDYSPSRCAWRRVCCCAGRRWMRPAWTPGRVPRGTRASWAPSPTTWAQVQPWPKDFLVAECGLHRGTCLTHMEARCLARGLPCMQAASAFAEYGRGSCGHLLGVKEFLGGRDTEPQTLTPSSVPACAQASTRRRTRWGWRVRARRSQRACSQTLILIP